MYNNPDNTDRPTIDLNRLESAYRSPEPEWSYRKERPLGVSLIAIWQFVGAGLAALIVLLALGVSGDSRLGGAVGLYACIFAITIPINIAIGVGLWGLKSWARVTFLIFGILSIILSIFSSSTSGSSVVSIVLNIAAVIYLFQPNVRDLFESPNGYSS